MRIAPHRVKEAGRIFVFDLHGVDVNDIRTNEICSMKESMHVLALGESVEFANALDFCVMETGRILSLDEMDATILEMSSVEIA